MHCGFMDSRLRRFPPDRVSAVPYGQTVDNAMRCPPLAHRSAAAHKLHSAQANRYKIRESQNQNPGTGLSLFQPGGCPNDRDHRRHRNRFGRCTRDEPYQHHVPPTDSPFGSAGHEPFRYPLSRSILSAATRLLHCEARACVADPAKFRRRSVRNVVWRRFPIHLEIGVV